MLHWLQWMLDAVNCASLRLYKNKLIMGFMKKLLISGLSTISLTILGLQPADSQVAVTIGGVSATAPERGTTNNLNLSMGSRTSLVVGSSTAFGSSVNLNTSAGVTAVSAASLIPTTIAIESAIGDNTEKLTDINISNLSSKDLVGSNSTTREDDVESSASGVAVIKGMSAKVDLKIKTPNTIYTEGSTAAVHAGPGEANYKVAVFPNRAGTVNSADCLADLSYCDYTASDTLSSGNAAASANLSTSTNIDINASEFTNVFAQSF